MKDTNCKNGKEAAIGCIVIVAKIFADGSDERFTWQKAQNSFWLDCHSFECQCEVFEEQICSAALLESV